MSHLTAPNDNQLSRGICTTCADVVVPAGDGEANVAGAAGGAQEVGAVGRTDGGEDGGGRRRGGGGGRRGGREGGRRAAGAVEA